MTTTLSAPSLTRSLSAFVTHLARRSKTVWRAALISGVIGPFVFLMAMGLGVGQMVNVDSGLGTDDYLSFVGPALLATAAMQQAGSQALWPTMGALKWEGNYQAALLTPLTPAELASGHLLWIGIRSLVTSGLFTLVLAAFGLVGSPSVIAAPFVAGIVGLSHAAPMSAFAATREHDQSFAILARALLFMFLFSGAFFPISQLPDLMEFVARMLPIYHGVELCRALLSGGLDLQDLGRLIYLLVLTMLGWMAAIRTFTARLAA